MIYDQHIYRKPINLLIPWEVSHNLCWRSGLTVPTDEVGICKHKRKKPFANYRCKNSKVSLDDSLLGDTKLLRWSLKYVAFYGVISRVFWLEYESDEKLALYNIHKLIGMDSPTFYGLSLFALWQWLGDNDS